eukprot:9082443-Ditylum_brightwellii.AAC.1
MDLVGMFCLTSDSTCGLATASSTPIGNKDIPLPVISCKKICFPKLNRVLHGGFGSVCSKGSSELGYVVTPDSESVLGVN